MKVVETMELKRIIVSPRLLENYHFLRLLLPPKSGGIAMTRKTDFFSNLKSN